MFCAEPSHGITKATTRYPVGPARCRLDHGLPWPHRLHDGHIDGYAQQQVNSDEFGMPWPYRTSGSGMPSATRKASYHHECERAS
jgi:hypothetical protein